MENISLEGEVWKDIVGYEGLYKVSNIGRVYSFYTNSIKKNYIEKIWKYHYTGLSKEKKYRFYKIHRLVAIAFLENKENKPQVNHINGIKSDNRAINLEWCTCKDNIIHAFTTGLMVGSCKGKFGADNHSSKKTYQYDLDGNLVNTFGSAAEAARFLNKSKGNISYCCMGGSKTAYGFIWRYY